MTATEPFVAPSEQVVVEVTGEERAGYLEDVTTQHVTDLEPGEVRGALHLESHGAPVAMFDVVVLADRLLLVVPDEDQADEVVESLGGKTFLRDATFTAGGWRVRCLRGDGAGGIAAAAGLGATDVADRPGRAVATDEQPVVVGREGGLDLLAEPDALEELVDRLVDAGAARAGPEVLESWRIRHGEPAWGSEVTAPHLPEEMGMLPTHVHLDKGCFPGQEAVARMWMLGRPRRRLARVRLSPPVDAGATLGSGRDKVAVTSVVPAAANGSVEALAFVPAGSEPGDELTADDVDVRVLEIVGAGQPIPGRDPSVTRRRDKDD